MCGRGQGFFRGETTFHFFKQELPLRLSLNHLNLSTTGTAGQLAPVSIKISCVVEETELHQDIVKKDKCASGRSGSSSGRRSSSIGRSSHLQTPKCEV